MIKWLIDTSYGVHWNLRGQSGGGNTLGRGFPVSGSTKQKLNTRSSTEAEVVGVDDFMPSILWSKLFLEAQGYSVTRNIIYQDNKSAMLLEANGKASSGKRTKHINIRYFFVTDRIQKGDVELEWCPTAEMTGDFFTKPLQGAVSKRFRDLIMGVVPHPEPGKGKSDLGKKLVTEEEKSSASGKVSSSRRRRSVLGHKGKSHSGSRVHSSSTGLKSWSNRLQRSLSVIDLVSNQKTEKALQRLVTSNGR